MNQHNIEPWLTKGWTKLLDKRERQFVAWFEGKYGREPNYRDVEEHWEDFRRQLSKDDR